jgi:hypothetical protein
LAVYEPAPEIPNSAVRYRGSPACSAPENLLKNSIQNLVVE